MLPTFIAIGAMKSGSTSLAEYLRAHPEVYLSEENEPHYFSFKDRQAMGVEWYESLFADAGDAKARGEASTSYTRYPNNPGTPGRMAQVVPTARLVYLVRNPIQRIRSHYMHELLRGMETRPLAEAVFERKNYLDTSRYAFQLDQYLEHFDREQILVITSENLRKRAETMSRVFDFIGVDPDAKPEKLQEEFHVTEVRRGLKPFEKRLQAIPGRRLASRVTPTAVKSLYSRVATRPMEDLRPSAEMSPEIQSRIADELRDDVTRLRAFLDADFDGWGIA